MKRNISLMAMLLIATYANAQQKISASDSIPSLADSLSAVTVVGHRPMFRMKNGNLITRVRNTPLSQEPMLEDVLKHIPGMSRNAEGSFEVNGLGKPTIYLNGKKATSAELSHLDVKQIEEIELITTPGAEYDATTGAVLKIIMHRRDEGIFGKLQAYDRISEVNTTNEAITMGWVGRTLSLSGFYGYQDFRYNVHQPQEAIVRYGDDAYLFGANRHGKNKQYANTSEVNLDWLPNKKHELGIQWEALWMSDGRSEIQQQYYLYPNEQMKYFDAESHQRGHLRNHHINAFHLGKWSQHLSSQLYLDYAKKINNDSQPIIEKEDGTEIETTNRSHADYDVYSGRLVVKEQLSQHHALSLGGEWSLVDGKGYTTSTNETLGTTEYKNHDTKTATYLQYQGTVGKWSWAAGIRYEHLTSRYTNLLDATSNMERTYDQWFPSFSISLHESSWQHTLNFRTSTARPSFSQLSGNIYYISRFQMQVSNPKLQPVNTYRLTYSAQWKDFYGMLRYTYINKPIMYVQEVPADKPVRYVSTFMNYGKQQKVYGYLNWGHAFGIWRPNMNIDGTYQFFKVKDHGEIINYNGFSWSMTLDNYFTLLHHCQLSLSYMFCNGGRNGRVQFKPYQNWSIGATKSFFGERMQIALNATDLFHQYLFREKIHQHLVDFSQTEDYKLWNCKLSITYKFNKRMGRYHGENSAKDEINRL